MKNKSGQCNNCQLKSSSVRTLNPAETERLEKNCTEVHFKKNDIIFKQNAFSSNIIYLNNGLVKIHIEGPQNEQIIKVVKAPSYLGIPTTFNEKINHYSATALEQTSVCFIDIDVFKDFIYKNGQFAYELITELCKNELNSFHRCVNRTQKHIHGRIADALLFFKNTFEHNEFILPFTRLEFGNFVDTSRESVSRILTEFKNDGIINLNGKKVEILNEKLLETISNKG
ncbi:MAG: Crp/Fnr family transcriptional regulator [Bacteroidetes bacterium]|nr:Crp/Fnr family transcriptional regulator [Bacteroidota bacterium]